MVRSSLPGVSLSNPYCKALCLLSNLFMFIVSCKRFNWFSSYPRFFACSIMFLSNCLKSLNINALSKDSAKSIPLLKLLKPSAKTKATSPPINVDGFKTLPVTLAAAAAAFWPVLDVKNFLRTGLSDTLLKNPFGSWSAAGQPLPLLKNIRPPFLAFFLIQICWTVSPKPPSIAASTKTFETLLNLFLSKFVKNFCFAMSSSLWSNFVPWTKTSSLIGAVPLIIVSMTFFWLGSKVPSFKTLNNWSLVNLFNVVSLFNADNAELILCDAILKFLKGLFATPSLWSIAYGLPKLLKPIW